MTNEQIILSVLTAEAKHIDAIHRESGLSKQDTSAALMILLMDGEILLEPGMRYKTPGKELP